MFDFDGVLVQSNAIKREAFFLVFEAWNRPDFIESCLEAHRADTRAEIVGCIVEKAGRAGLLDPTVPVASITRDFLEHYTARCHRDVVACAEVPGMRACLDFLLGRVPLYINSATPQAPLERILSARGLDRYFTGVFGAESGKLATLNWVLEAERLPPDALVFVGDAEGDRRAAIDCGCRFAGIRNESNDFSETPAIMIDRLDQLLAVPAWRWPS